MSHFLSDSLAEAYLGDRLRAYSTGTTPRGSMIAPWLGSVTLKMGHWRVQAFPDAGMRLTKPHPQGDHCINLSEDEVLQAASCLLPASAKARSLS